MRAAGQLLTSYERQTHDCARHRSVQAGHFQPAAHRGHERLPQPEHSPSPSAVPAISLKDGAVKDARAPEAAGSRCPRTGSALEACTRITGALSAHGRTKMLPKASSAG